jgi:hypothetical protein
VKIVTIASNKHTINVLTDILFSRYNNDVNLAFRLDLTTETHPAKPAFIFFSPHNKRWDIDIVVPHQASKVGLLMLERFGWPEVKIMRTIEWLGNCVAASIPSTLYQAVRDGNIQRG